MAKDIKGARRAKMRSVRIDARLYDAAAERLDAAGWNSIDYAIEYFLAECAVRKRLPAFLNMNSRRSCAVCKFYDPIYAEQWKARRAAFQERAREGKSFTALLHPTREGGFWCEIPAFAGCCSQGSTLAEAKYMIKDAALAWLGVKDVKLRYRVERENERDAELMVYNTPEAARRFLAKDKSSSRATCAAARRPFVV